MKNLFPLDDENPFEDEHGKNPFADGEPPGKPSGDDNLFGAPQVAEPAFQSASYERFLPHRGGLVLTCASIGVALLGGLFCCPLTIAASLPFSLAATLMGRQDLRAMKRGAMDDSGRTSTLVGVGLGLVTLLVVFVCAIWAVYTIVVTYRQSGWKLFPFF